MACHIKKGDSVVVISGDYRDAARVRKVLSVDPKAQRVVVEGVNTVYKHVRPSRKNPQGGRLQVERPIHMSNVLPVNPKTNRATRVSFQIDDDGKKSRVAADGSVIDVITKTRG